MTGVASCQNSGIANTAGSLGWAVAEVDQGGTITNVQWPPYVDEYYINVNHGQTRRAVVDNANFSNTIIIPTAANMWYHVYVWFWGAIEANGEEDTIYGSQASGYGHMWVQSIAWQWLPLPFP
jgi:hypothetical protein